MEETESESDREAAPQHCSQETAPAITNTLCKCCEVHLNEIRKLKSEILNMKLKLPAESHSTETKSNRAAWVLTFSSYDADADCLIRKLDWKKLEDQRKAHTAVMVYKSINGLASDYMRSLFTDRGSISNYSLRDSGSKLAIPKPRTNFLKNSFSYRGAVLWNSLPVGLRQADSLNSFKKGCCSYL